MTQFIMILIKHSLADFGYHCHHGVVTESVKKIEKLIGTVK